METKRLLFKPVTPQLIHELFNTKSKEEIMDFFGFTESSYLTFKNMHEQGMESYRISIFFFVLVDKESGLAIGEVGFHTWNVAHHRAELYYNLFREDFKRKGLMSEALPLVLQYGFTQLKLHRIQALIAAENTASLRLLQANKFTFEGTLRQDYKVGEVFENSECYSLLKNEWENQSKDF